MTSSEILKTGRNGTEALIALDGIVEIAFTMPKLISTLIVREKPSFDFNHDAKKPHDVD